MKTIKHFTVFSEKKITDTVKHGSLELKIDPDFNKYHHAVQCASIDTVPYKVNELFENDPVLQKGDKVYFHHFVVQDVNSLKENIYVVTEPSFLWCLIRSGEIIPLGDQLLCQPIKESGEVKTDSGLWLKWNEIKGDHLHNFGSNIAEVKQHAKITHVSENCKRAGIKTGDIIVFRQDADYDIEIEGQKYFRMKKDNILIVMRDGIPVPIGDNLLIEVAQIENEVRSSGIEVVKLRQDKTPKAKVIRAGETATLENFNLSKKEWGTYDLNDTVVYQGGAQISINDKPYILLRDVNILGFYPN